MIDRFGPGVGHLNYLADPGVGIFEVLFVPLTTNHFPEWEIQLYLTYFCPGVGNLTAIFWQMSKSRPMHRLPPAGLTLIGAFFHSGVAEWSFLGVTGVVYSCKATYLDSPGV